MDQIKQAQQGKVLKPVSQDKDTLPDKPKSSSVHETRDNLLREIREARSNVQLKSVKAKVKTNVSVGKVTDGGGGGGGLVDELKAAQTNKQQRESQKKLNNEGSSTDSESVKKPSNQSTPPPTHSVQDKKPIPDNIPPWRKAMLERKRREELATEEEDVEEPPPVLLDKDGKPLPTWKQAIILMKKDKVEQEIVRQKKAADEKEARYAGMPDWKKKFLKERHAMQAKLTQVELEREKELKQKVAEIKAMPEWKRELYLKKYPEYKEHM